MTLSLFSVFPPSLRTQRVSGLGVHIVHLPVVTMVPLSISTTLSAFSTNSMRWVQRILVFPLSSSSTHFFMRCSATSVSTAARGSSRR